MKKEKIIKYDYDKSDNYYDQYNYDYVVIDNRSIKINMENINIEDKISAIISGIYIDDVSDCERIIDTMSYIRYKLYKRVIFNIKNISDMRYFDQIINNFIIKDTEVEIMIKSSMSNEDMMEIHNYIVNSNRKISICAKIVGDDYDTIFKIFRKYIKTIDIDDCMDKEQCINDSRIIHFDGNIICSDDSFVIEDNKDKNSDKTFYRLISDNIITNPDKELFTFVNPSDPSYEANYTYREFDEKVNEAAKALIHAGIKKGSHIGIWMNSIPEWFIYFYAITKIGAIAIPINKDNREYDMEHILKTNDIDMLIMTNGHEKNNYMNTIKKLIPEINSGTVKSKKFPHLKNIVTVGFSERGCISNEEFIKNGQIVSEEEVEYMAAQVCNDDVAIILPTSGTTNRPKGVLLTHKSIIDNGTYIGDNLKLNPNDIMGIIVTMFHCFGITLSMTAAMTHNTKMVIPEIFRPYQTIKMISDHDITCINGAPKHFSEMIMAYNDFIENTGKKIKIDKGIMAGCNCSSKLIEAVENIFDMNVISVYGQTELAPGDTMSNVDDTREIRWNTVGRKFEGIVEDIKIVDDENNEVPDGEMGEIVVKSRDVMIGYYGDIDETRKMYDSDGYFHSGDLGVKTGDCYKIVGRKKNMIIRNGENIQPKEVEDVLMTLTDMVEDACVFGIVVDESGNQEVAAAIIPANQNVTEEDIRATLKTKIAGFKVPSRIFFVDHFEYNANGKIVIDAQREACRASEGKKLVNVLKKIYE